MHGKSWKFQFWRKCIRVRYYGKRFGLWEFTWNYGQQKKRNRNISAKKKVKDSGHYNEKKNRSLLSLKKDTGLGRSAAAVVHLQLQHKVNPLCFIVSIWWRDYYLQVISCLSVWEKKFSTQEIAACLKQMLHIHVDITDFYLQL